MDYGPIIIKKNLNILYSNPANKTIFKKKTLIGADRRRKNLGEIYKPTIPRRFPIHGPHDEPGFFTCMRKCDTCRHSNPMKRFTSPWDGRTWPIKSHLTCTTPNMVYILTCSLHPNMWYVGSTTKLKARWAGHKSDCNLGLTTKCVVAKHVNALPHPQDRNLSFLSIFPIESVKEERSLLEREIYWQCNTGSVFTGLNVRTDFKTLHRVQYKLTH